MRFDWREGNYGDPGRPQGVTVDLDTGDPLGMPDKGYIVMMDEETGEFVRAMNDITGRSILEDGRLKYEIGRTRLKFYPMDAPEAQEPIRRHRECSARLAAAREAGL